MAPSCDHMCLPSSGQEQDSSASSDRVNSNTIPTSSGGDVGARMRQALEYKRSRASNAASVQAASRSAGMPAEASGLSAAAPAASGRFAGKMPSGGSVSGQGASFNGRLANLPPNAPLRVRNAMNAAMQYRQDKAERSAAAAREAAAQVAAKSVDRARLAANVTAPQPPSVNGAQACVGQASQVEAKSVESRPGAASNGAEKVSGSASDGILRGCRCAAAHRRRGVFCGHCRTQSCMSR